MGLPVKQLIEIGKQQLKEAGVADAENDAKELFCYMMHIERSKFFLMWQDNLYDNQCEAYFDLVAERGGKRRPLQHITGVQEFMGIKIHVNEDVLIPRQETEVLVEDAVELIREGTLRKEPYAGEKRRSADVLDLCCGSGAIGIAIAKSCGEARVTMSDVSEKAVEVARKNALAAGVKGFKTVESNMFDALSGTFGKKKYDYIVTNPPYIPTGVIGTLEPEVRDHEPSLALDGGEDGLKFYREIVQKAPEHLKKSGILMMEIGHDQLDAVKKLLEETDRFCKIVGLQDLAGRDRIVVATAAAAH